MLILRSKVFNNLEQTAVLPHYQKHQRTTNKSIYESLQCHRICEIQWTESTWSLNRYRLESKNKWHTYKKSTWNRRWWWDLLINWPSDKTPIVPHFSSAWWLYWIKPYGSAICAKNVEDFKVVVTKTLSPFVYSIKRLEILQHFYMYSTVCWNIFDLIWWHLTTW